jgi:Tfp pilus assembly protein PilF
MDKDTNSSANGDPFKSKVYFIIGYIFLMAMALAWSVDPSIVYIFFGIAVFFLFLGFYSRPSRKNFQDPFKSTSNKGDAPSAKLPDIFAAIFHQARTGSSSKPKTFTRHSTPEDNRRLVSFVIGAVFLLFFIFFIGSVFFSSSDSADDSVLYFQTAEENFWNQNYDSAYLNYRKALKADDQYVEAMVGYGRVLSIRNEQDSAMIMFEKALTINPDYKEAGYNKAWIYFGQQKYNESVGVLTPLLQENADYYDAMLLIGDSYYELKQFDDAMVWYSKAYENEGIRTRALCHVMAYIHDTKGNYTDAIDLYKEALRYDSTVVDIYKRLGELLPNEDGNYYRIQAVKLQQN